MPSLRPSEGGFGAAGLQESPTVRFQPPSNHPRGAPGFTARGFAFRLVALRSGRRMLRAEGGG